MRLKVYLVNVGVNQSHRLRSPVYSDGRFEFVPIPEVWQQRPLEPGRHGPVTYSQLHTFNGNAPLLNLFPARARQDFLKRAVHYDPNLGNPNDGSIARFSYGDVPRVNIRARNLLAARPGDLLIFLANLAPYDPGSGQFSKAPRGFYMIAAMEIANILEYPSPAGQLLDKNTGAEHRLAAWQTNAHVRRLLARPAIFEEEPFSIFVPGADKRRFVRAVPITRQLCDECLNDSRGRPFAYKKFRSLNACVGAYTRTVRAHFDLDVPEDLARFRRLVQIMGTEGAVFYR